MNNKSNTDWYVVVDLNRLHSGPILGFPALVVNGADQVRKKFEGLINVAGVEALKMYKVYKITGNELAFNFERVVFDQFNLTPVCDLRNSNNQK